MEGAGYRVSAGEAFRFCLLQSGPPWGSASLRGRVGAVKDFQRLRRLVYSITSSLSPLFPLSEGKAAGFQTLPLGC